VGRAATGQPGYRIAVRRLISPLHLPVKPASIRLFFGFSTERGCVKIGLTGNEYNHGRMR